MKRNNLTTAILAGITGVAGIASVSNAVNLNSDGTGQVLIYPYYTVNNGLNTLISVVNTTDRSKAVKVRFLEGKNSRECLDFNVYLSAYDVWTAGLVAATATSLFSPGFEGQDTTKIITNDNSCTDPANISGFEFLPFALDATVGLNLSRCTEGHFEMIDMGDITDQDTIDGIDHTDTGTPTDCSVVVSNFVGAGEIWNDPANITGIDASSGGLFGSASVIDVAGGVDVAYNADALEGFTTANLLTDPGNLKPGLSDGTVITSDIFNGNSVVTDTWLVSSVQAVSAVYMHDSIFGEYVLSDSIGANTEWVVTFPTKNFYVDPARQIADLSVGPDFNPVAVPPFTEVISVNGACEVYNFEYYDREEQIPDPRLIGRPPSPRPPTVQGDDAVFCWETNVVEFEDQERTSGASVILGSSSTTHFITQSVAQQTATTTTPAVDAAYFDTGWVAIHFTQSTVATDNVSGNIYTGLPVTGFAIQRYTNTNLDGGVLANYAGIFKHRYSRSITTGP